MFALSRDWTTRLLLRKTLLTSIFDSLEFLSSMSCIVLGFELADKNVFKELRVFNDGNFQRYSSRPHKNTNP